MLRVRRGVLEIEYGPQGDKTTVCLDVDDAKPHTILFDGRGEFLTGEAMRWCARYGIGLILPDGPGRMLTVLQSALEAVDGETLPDTDPAVIRAQCAADAVGIAREIVRAKIQAEASHVARCYSRDMLASQSGGKGYVAPGHMAFHTNAIAEWLPKLDSADTIPQIIATEAQAAMAYWRAFKDAGLREAKGGNLPRSGLRFANRNKGAQFLGNKHASHPINAMLNYAYVVEAGRLAKALAARGLALPIGFLHSDKKGRNSLVWDAIEPIRPAIDARVFAYIASREFARSDFPQSGASTFRLARPIIAEMLSEASLPPDNIAGAADFMLRTIERHAGGEYRLFKADLRRRKRAVNALAHAV